MPKQMDWTEGENPGKPKRSRKASPRGRAGAGETPATARSGGSAVEGATASAGEAGNLVAAEGKGLSATDANDATGVEEIDPAAFEDTAHLEKKGFRVVPVVTGAVVDASGSFLFYVDGHDDARAGVQAQLNHLLDSGPSREEHLARARARVRYLLKKLSTPR